MTQLTPYLTFDGQCADAVHFYEEVLGADIETMMTFAGSPMEHDIAPEHMDRIMHATLYIGDQAIMASDGMPGVPYEGMKGFSLALNYDTVEEATEVFEALAEEGTIRMPLQNTFWAEAFGMVVDRFGTPWMVSCEGDGDEDDEDAQ